jgi:hypothetical protein
MASLSNNKIEENSITDSEIITNYNNQNHMIFFEENNLPQNSIPDFENLTNLWDNFLNTSTVPVKPHIEYDSFSGAIYTGYAVQHNEEYLHHNISKYNSQHQLEWEKTIGNDNESNILMDLKISPDGKILYSLSFSFATFSIEINAYNTSFGINYDNIPLNIENLENINKIIIDKSGRFMYLTGIRIDFSFSIGLWKLDLLTHEIIWTQIYGDGENVFQPVDMQLSIDNQFIYILGQKTNQLNENSTLYLQFHNSGSLIGEFFNITNPSICPLYFLLNDDGKSFTNLMIDFSSLFPTLVFIQSDLNGRWLSHNLIQNTMYSTITIESMQLNYSNDSIIIIGSRNKNNENASGYIAEFAINGSLIWENQTADSNKMIQIYTDFVFIEEFSFINLIGYTFQSSEIIFDGVQFYLYDLRNPPLAPKLRLNENPSHNGIIQLNWENTTRASNYSVFRSTQLFEECDGSLMIASGINNLEYLDSVPTNGTYFYRVVACGPYGNSTPSNIIEGFESHIATPYLISVKNWNGIRTSAIINWTEPPIEKYRYHIYRNESAEFNYTLTKPLYSVLHSDIFTNLSFIEENVPEGTWYYGVVCEYFEDIVRQNSTISNIQKIIIPPYYESFVITKALEGPSINNITIEWPMIPDATQYKIYRQLFPYNSTDSFSPIIITDLTHFFDDPLPEKKYYWKIEAYNENIRLNQSFLFESYIFSPFRKPILPEYIGNVTDNIVFLSWDSIPHAEFYYVLRSINIITEFNHSLIIGNVTNSKTWFTHSYTETGDFYYAIVAARNGLNSTLSNNILISFQHFPNPIENLNILNGKNDGTWGENNEKTIWTINDRFVQMNWTPIENSWVYQILRNFEPITPYNVNDNMIIGTTTNLDFFDYSIINGQAYYYIIRGINGTGNGKINTSLNQYVAIRFNPDPVNVQLISSINYSVTLNWTMGTYNTTSYLIIRSKQLINNSNWYNFIIDQTSITNYTQYDIPFGLWYYAIIAYNAQGKYSNISNCIPVTISPEPFQPLLAQISSPNYIRNVTLIWDKISQSGLYFIYRTSDPITEINIENLSPIGTTNQSFYSDTSALPGIYYYAIQARNESGNSTISNSRKVQVIHLPDTPKWEIPNYEIYINRINISWIDHQNYSQYSIYRTESEFWNETAAILVNQSISDKYFILNDTSRIRYQYWVFAYNGSGRSLNGEPISLQGIKMDTPIVQIIPQNPIVTHNVTLKWQNISWSSSYKIYRDNNPNFIASQNNLIAIITENKTFSEYLSDLGKYYYIIIPISPFGIGDPSDTIEVRVEDLPPVPVLLKVIATDETSIMITWNLLPEVDGYIAFYSREPITQEILRSKLTASPLLNNQTSNFTFKEIGVGTFYFAIVSINGSGISNYSNILTFSNLREIGIPQSMITKIAILGGIGGFVAIIIVVKLIYNRKNDPDHLLQKFGLEVP